MSLAVLRGSRCALHLGVLVAPGCVAHVRGVRRLGVALRCVVGDVARRRDRRVQGTLHEAGNSGEVGRRDALWRMSERMLDRQVVEEQVGAKPHVRDAECPLLELGLTAGGADEMQLQMCEGRVHARGGRA